MKKILFDMEVLMDMLNKRGDHEAALMLFDLCVKKKIKGHVASFEIADLCERMEEKKYQKNKRSRIVSTLLDNLSVLSPREELLKNAFHSKVKEYKKALLDELASWEKVDLIVTAKGKGMKDSANTVMSSREALEFLED